ncbi:SPX domain-containing protein 1 [Bienertia sinuspersici]
MKFWKIVSPLILQTLPDWRDKFLSYKDLKKQLKRIYPINGDQTPSRPSKRPKVTSEGREIDDDIPREVNNFICLLEAEIDKFNFFFLEKEEEYVIRWKRRGNENVMGISSQLQRDLVGERKEKDLRRRDGKRLAWREEREKELQDRLEEVRHSNEELMRVGREFVDLHGEMVLLENYSALNYTGLVKILKKYDKRSEQCEVTLDRLFAQNELHHSSQLVTNTGAATGSSSGSTSKEKLLFGDEDLSEIEHMENMYMKLTLSALRALKEIRSGSSTVNELSLPPLDSSGI